MIQRILLCIAKHELLQWICHAAYCLLLCDLPIFIGLVGNRIDLTYNRTHNIQRQKKCHAC